MLHPAGLRVALSVRDGMDEPRHAVFHYERAGGGCSLVDGDDTGHSVPIVDFQHARAQQHVENAKQDEDGEVDEHASA